MQFENLVMPSDENNASDETECLQSKKSSVLSNALIRFIIVFVMTWKIRNKLSEVALSVWFCFLTQTLELLGGVA